MIPGILDDEDRDWYTQKDGPLMSAATPLSCLMSILIHGEEGRMKKGIPAIAALVIVLGFFSFNSAAAEQKVGERCRCDKDADCAASCSQCAVNALWYQRWSKENADCSDGCAHQGTSSKCERGRCIMLDVIMHQATPCRDTAGDHLR